MKEIAKNFSKGNFAAITSNLISTSLIGQFENNIYSQQILVSITAFSLIKEKKNKMVSELYSQFTFDNKTSIFPYLFLKAKMYGIAGNQSEAMLIYNELKKRYEDTSKSEIAEIEANSHFEYFSNFFNYLFGINNTDLKFKKAVFELKNCFNILGFNDEAFGLIDMLYLKYPNDLMIQFEMAKDCILLGNTLKFESVLKQMKLNKNDLTDAKDNLLDEAYDIHIRYAEILKILSKNEYEATKKSLSEIIKIETGNIVLLNNISIMNVYENQIKSCFEKLGMIATDSNNQTIHSNKQLLTNLLSTK